MAKKKKSKSVFTPMLQVGDLFSSPTGKQHLWGCDYLRDRSNRGAGWVCVKEGRKLWTGPKSATRFWLELTSRKCEDSVEVDLRCWNTTVDGVPMTLTGMLDWFCRKHFGNSKCYVNLWYEE
jgi:hypothetical protein